MTDGEFDLVTVKAVPVERIEAFAAFDPQTGEPALGIALTATPGNVWPVNGRVIVGVRRSELAAFLRSVRKAAVKVEASVTEESHEND